MHEHDLSLIMALADGTLDTEEQAAAEAEIASCPTCAEDLAMQRLAVSALRSAPPAALNDIERARLRRTVRDELGLVPGAATAAQTGAAAVGARRYRLFAALAGAAAVFIAFVAVAPTLLGGGDDDAGSEAPLEVAFSESTEAADGADAVAEDEQEEAADRSLTGGADAADDVEALTAAPETTTAATEATAQPETASEDTPPEAYVYWSEADVEGPPNLAELADDLAAQKSLEPVVGPQAAVSPEALADLDLARCLDLGLEAAPNATDAFIVGVSDISDVEVVITAYVAGNFESVTVLAQDLATCRVVASS